MASPRGLARYMRALRSGEPIVDPRDERYLICPDGRRVARARGASDWPPAADHSYRDQVLSYRGLIGHYGLGDRSGTAAAALGAAPDGVYTGGCTLGAKGPTLDQDPAVTFDGSTGYVLITQGTNDPALNVGDIFTLAAFVKPATLAQYQAIISGNRSVNNQARAYLRVNQTTGAIELDRFALNGVVTSTIGIDTSKFWHVCATKNGGTVKLYIDGVDRTGTVTNATMEANPGGNAPWTIGANRNESGVLGDFFNGTIGKVSIWNRALSAAEVAKLVNAR